MKIKTLESDLFTQVKQCVVERFIILSKSTIKVFSISCDVPYSVFRLLFYLYLYCFIATIFLKIV